MNKLAGNQAQVFSLQFPNPKIIFLYGFPGCGLKQQADRLKTEFGYVHLDMKELMMQEVKRGSADGDAIQKTLNAGVIPSDSLRIKLLKRAFSITPAPSYVITGFLKNLSETLEFEKQVCGIKVIVNFIISDWPDFYAKNEKNTKRDKIGTFLKARQEVIEFYKTLNIVRSIDAVGVVEKVFRRLKSAIQPELFFIIGPPSSGKSTLGKKMSEKYNLHYIDLEKLIWEKNINNQLRKLTDDDSITRKVLLTLEQNNSMRYLIEGFPMNLYQLKKFETAFGAPKKLFYLALFKEELQKRTSKPNISLEYFDYVNKAGSMIDYVQKKEYFCRVNVNLTVSESFLQVSKEIEPEVILMMNDAHNHLKTFLENQGYQYFNLDQAMRSVCSRQTERGKDIIMLTEGGKVVPARLLIQIMQEFIYSGSTFGKKFILGGVFPSKIKELQFIENNCVSISKVFYYTANEEHPISSHLEEETIETYMFKRNKLVRLQGGENYSEMFSSELNIRQNRKIGKYVIFIGSVLSGKSVQAKKFAVKTGYKLVNYEELPDIIKAKKSTEDEPYEKVSYEDILEEILSYMTNPTDTIILDGLPAENLVLTDIEVSADDEEVKDRTPEYLEESYSKLFKHLGQPYLVFHLSTDMKNLRPRLFKRLELTPEDELNEDQIEILNKSIKFDHSLARKFKHLNHSFSLTSYKSLKKNVYYEVNTNLSESRSFAYILSVSSPKLIIVEEVLKQHPSLLVSNMCLNNDIRHLHVPDLIKLESTQDTARGELVNNLLKQRVTVPSSILIPVLKDSLKTLPIGDQLVLITGLFSNDPQEQPRTMELFMSIEENVGEIVGIVIITPRMRREIVEIEKIPVVHYPPPKKEEEQAKNEEEEEDGEEKAQKPPEVIFPPRSNNSKPVNLPKIFQLYKRNVAKFNGNSKDLEFDSAIGQVFDYVASRKYLSMDDQERFKCPNIQIIV